MNEIKYVPVSSLYLDNLEGVNFDLLPKWAQWTLVSLTGMVAISFGILVYLQEQGLLK